MSIRDAKREELRRLESKTLDARFKRAIQEELNCSLEVMAAFHDFGRQNNG